MQSETLAQEFARLIKEYHEGDDHTKPEAWNLLADYAVDNADAISAALSDKQAGEVKKLAPSDVYEVLSDFYKNERFDFDHAAEISRKIYALVDVPAVEPVAWAMKLDGHIIATTFKSAEASYMKSANANCDLIPLYARPPLREGEDSAEVLRSALQRISELTPARANAKDARDLHHTVKAIADVALAATRSTSATTATGGGRG